MMNGKLLPVTLRDTHTQVTQCCVKITFAGADGASAAADATTHRPQAEVQQLGGDLAAEGHRKAVVARGQLPVDGATQRTVPPVHDQALLVRRRRPFQGLRQ